MSKFLDQAMMSSSQNSGLFLYTVSPSKINFFGTVSFPLFSYPNPENILLKQFEKKNTSGLGYLLQIKDQRSRRTGKPYPEAY